jgi:hypothetical protein
MSFNFASSIAKAQEKNTTQGLISAIILGSSGHGKSTLSNSLGCKTLFLYLRGESHGVLTKSIHKDSDTVGVCIDQDDEGRALPPGQAYVKLLSILNSPNEIKEAGFKAIVVDSLAEMEALIKLTPQFTNKVSGNKFKETDVLVEMMREVVLKLNDLQTQIGIHYICTCPLDIKELDKDTGEIIEAQVKLTSYRLAESMVCLFPDVLTVGPVSNGKTSKYRIQFMSNVSKAQKDVNGAIKRSINFKPRISSVDLEAVMPEYGHIAADLKEVIKMKLGTFQA